MTPVATDAPQPPGILARTARTVVAVAAAAAGLAACAALALSPVGAWLGRIVTWSGVAALVWDSASSGVRAVRRRIRP